MSFELIYEIVFPCFNDPYISFLRNKCSISLSSRLQVAGLVQNKCILSICYMHSIACKVNACVSNLSKSALRNYDMVHLETN
jgi:hypothetical protein